jgi:hypothetical protein
MQSINQQIEVCRMRNESVLTAAIEASSFRVRERPVSQEWAAFFRPLLAREPDLLDGLALLSGGRLLFSTGVLAALDDVSCSQVGDSFQHTTGLSLHPLAVPTSLRPKY